MSANQTKEGDFFFPTLFNLKFFYRGEGVTVPIILQDKMPKIEHSKDHIFHHSLLSSCDSFGFVLKPLTSAFPCDKLSFAVKIVWCFHESNIKYCIIWCFLVYLHWSLWSHQLYVYNIISLKQLIIFFLLLRLHENPLTLQRLWLLLKIKHYTRLHTFWVTASFRRKINQNNESQYLNSKFWVHWSLVSCFEIIWAIWVIYLS